MEGTQRMSSKLRQSRRVKSAQRVQDWKTGSAIPTTTTTTTTTTTDHTPVQSTRARLQGRCQPLQ